MEVGDGDLTDEGFPARVERRALDPVAADGVRAVEDHEAAAVFGAGLHGEGHGADVSVGSAADVLEVEEDDIDIGEHAG